MRSKTRLKNLPRTGNLFEIIYIPRIQDEVVVARFDTEDEAKSHMDMIKEKKPKAYPHHYIKKIENEEDIGWWGS